MSLMRSKAFSRSSLRSRRSGPGGDGLMVEITGVTGNAQEHPDADQQADSPVRMTITDVPIGPELPKTPTGIRGLDEITGGGLPEGRVTLVTGNTGAGKTLLGLEFLVAGARKYGEPGVLVTFEESAAKVAANVSSLGFDLESLQRDELLAVLSFRVDPSEIVETRDFDFEPLFAVLADAIGRVGAKRVVLDTIEVLFGVFHDEASGLAELNRLVRWLEEQGVTTIITGEGGGGAGYPSPG